MDTKKVAGAVIALVLAVAGGGFALSLDFSTTTQDDHSVTDSSTTVINEGDTIINEAVQDFTDDIFDDLIDRSYDYFCEEVEPDSPECDEYWED